MRPFEGPLEGVAFEGRVLRSMQPLNWDTAKMLSLMRPWRRYRQNGRTDGRTHNSLLQLDGIKLPPSVWFLEVDSVPVLQGLQTTQQLLMTNTLILYTGL